MRAETATWDYTSTSTGSSHAEFVVYASSAATDDFVEETPARVPDSLFAGCVGPDRRPCPPPLPARARDLRLARHSAV